MFNVHDGMQLNEKLEKSDCRASLVKSKFLFAFRHNHYGYDNLSSKMNKSSHCKRLFSPAK